MAAVVQRWTSSEAREAATAIVRVLREEGHTAYFAGGCVRDGLLGAEPVDFDVATSARPDAIQSLFRRTTAVGASFGVVLVIERGITVEVATFRSDGPYSDKRRPDHVEFTDPEHDAQRRDFTVNALFLDPLAGKGGESPTHERGVHPPSPGLQSGVDSRSGDQGENAGPRTEVRGSDVRPVVVTPGVIDFVGGLDDLRAGLIRAVGEPEKRLAEDHLRALRAVRFAARYGFEIEPGTAAAIGAHATDLAGVSRERIGEEFRRMMAHPTRARAVGLLGELGLDRVLLGESAGPVQSGVLSGLQVPKTHDTPRTEVRGSEGGRHGSENRTTGEWATFPSCLAAIAFDRAEVGSAAVIPALVRRWRGSLCLSNDEKSRLRDILFGVVEMASAWHDLPVAQRKRRAASVWFPEALAVATARDPGLGSAILADIEALAADGVGLAPEPMLDGNDLLGLGIAPGPVFARVLDALYDAQLEGRVRQKADAVALAAELGGLGGV